MHGSLLMESGKEYTMKQRKRKETHPFNHKNQAQPEIRQCGFNRHLPNLPLFSDTLTASEKQNAEEGGKRMNGKLIGKWIAAV